MNKSCKRVGVYGGGFDPVHNAHLCLAKTALEALSLDGVMFVPSAGQAHYKKETNIASSHHRLAMLNLAIEDEPTFQASDIEIKQESFCYTIDTLRALRTQHPNTDFILLIGGDWKQKLYTWKEGEKIPREFAVALFSRPGADVETNLEPDKLEERIYTVNMPLMDISSSDIRQRIQDGRTIEDMAPNSVIHYIHAHQLYR